MAVALPQAFPGNGPHFEAQIGRLRPEPSFLPSPSCRTEVPGTEGARLETSSGPRCEPERARTRCRQQYQHRPSLPGTGNEPAGVGGPCSGPGKAEDDQIGDFEDSGNHHRPLVSGIGNEHQALWVHAQLGSGPGTEPRSTDRHDPKAISGGASGQGEGQ